MKAQVNPCKANPSKESLINPNFTRPTKTKKPKLQLLVTPKKQRNPPQIEYWLKPNSKIIAKRVLVSKHGKRKIGRPSKRRTGEKRIRKIYKNQKGKNFYKILKNKKRSTNFIIAYTNFMSINLKIKFSQ